MLDPVSELSRWAGVASDPAALVEPTTVQVGAGVGEDGPAPLGPGERVVGGGELAVDAGSVLSEDWLPPHATPSTRSDPRAPATSVLAKFISLTEPELELRTTSRLAAPATKH
jgi:hypothetical protein